MHRDRHHSVESQHAGDFVGREIEVVRVGEIEFDAAGPEVRPAPPLVD
jgi:hypothetical protein